MGGLFHENAKKPKYIIDTTTFPPASVFLRILSTLVASSV